MTSTCLTITLFREFSLSLAGRPAINFAGDRPVSLLAYLLLHRHTSVSRPHLAFTLWPDSTDSQARTNLRNLFYTLRRTLPQADSYLAADSMTLQWRSDAPYSLDVADFESALGAAATGDSPRDKIAHLETAVSLYKGDLLPACYDDWIIPWRENLRQSYLDALHQLILLLEQEGDYRASARYGHLLLQQDPLNETAYVQLMRMHARKGDRAGVRRVYESCVATLRRELDVEPAPATRAAYEHLIRLEGPVEEFSTGQSPPTPPAPTPRPLPTPATPFIDREQELAHIAGLLANPESRLITIVGTGGIGKTRLALAAAARQGKFPDGVAFVPLGAVFEAVRVIPAIADALNFTFSGGSDPRAQLFQYLSDKKVLLVLDNVEQLLGEIDFLSELLQAAPGIVLLVTSHERLNLLGEWLVPVDGMPVPQVDDPAGADNPAVRLFLESAQRLLPGFVPDQDDLKGIFRICELVEGMPLGLELAASWVRLLTCPEIARELEGEMDFLRTSHRDVPPRHRSIRAVFDHSWDLLSSDEQGLLVRLSVFRDGFTREAAQQVGGATLALLGSLVDKSLLRSARSGRYAVHELIRQYAAKKLAALPELHQGTAARHSAYYLHLLAQQETALGGPYQKEVLARLNADINNLLFAWDWAVEHRVLDQLRAASWPFWYYFELRGAFLGGEKTFQRAEVALGAALALQDAPEASLLTTWANVQTHRAFLTFRRGRATEALEPLAGVVALLRDHSDEDALRDALWAYGMVCWLMEQFNASADSMREALDISSRRERPWSTAVDMSFLGIMEHELGNYDEAYRLLGDGLALAQELGDPRMVIYVTGYLSRTAQALGRYDHMAALLQEGLRQAIEENDRFAIAISWLQLGKGALAMGRAEEAFRNFDESIALFRETGDKVNLALVLNHAGEACTQTGDEAGAEKYYREALETALATETWPTAISALAGLVKLYARQEDFTRVLALTNIVLQHPVQLSVQEQVADLRQKALDRLTPAQQTVVQSWLGGRVLPLLVDDILQNKLPA